jgi:hypothetical protein
MMNTSQQAIGTNQPVESTSGEGHLDAMINRITARLRLFDLVAQSGPVDLPRSAAESTPNIRPIRSAL